MLSLETIRTFSHPDYFLGTIVTARYYPREVLTVLIAHAYLDQPPALKDIDNFLCILT